MKIQNLLFQPLELDFGNKGYFRLNPREIKSDFSVMSVMSLDRPVL